jgi:hypothetical protein
MRKTILFFITAGIIVLGFNSCSEDEVVNTVKIGLVNQVNNSGTIIRSIEYNAQNRPVKMNFFNSTGFPDGYLMYDLGDDSLVDKISAYNQQKVLTSFTTYMYDTSKKLLTKKYYNVKSGNSILSHSEAYTYNAENQLINQSDFDSVGNVTYYMMMIYDTNDDASEVKYYSPTAYIGSLYYKYDSKPNVYAKFWKSMGLEHPNLKHNITQLSSSLTPTAGKVNINVGKYNFTIPLFSASFEYGQNNLPTKEIRVYLDGNTISETYGYK